MCSKYCPCEPNLAIPWTNMTESELNKWKRTKVVGAAFQDTANNTRIFTTTTAGAIRFSKF